MALNDIIKTTGLGTEIVPFHPSPEEQDLVLRVYNDFIYDYNIKNQGWQILNNRTLEKFWADSNYDYNQIVEDDVNNPVTQYSSGITRDKSNTFILKLSKENIYPSVIALNDNQEVDMDVSSIGKPLLKWQYCNDGRPSESGKSKGFRYTHKQVVEGTVHILDIVGPDGRLCSYEIPNEEVFIPNFYEFDLQRQSHFLRVQQWASYAQAEEQFGDCPNFKSVVPGSLGWLNQTFDYKEKYKAIVYQDQCTVVWAWYPVREKELARLKKIGKLPKWVEKTKYFNVIINGIPMFKYDNLMPYYHGNFPVTKAVFENFSPSNFYWGNSQPNKAHQDKKFLDGWKTLIRYKGKLSAIPAYLNFTGHHVENDIVVPGITTDMPSTFDPAKFVAVPGTDKGVTNSDQAVLRDVTADIDRESIAPMSMGMYSGERETARQIMMVQQNAEEILAGLAQQLTFREEARAFPILKSTFQFLPRNDLKKIAIPNEVFPDGTSGNLEIIFKNPGKMTDDEKLAASYKIKNKETEAKRKGLGLKIMYVNPEYLMNLDLYCESAADQYPQTNSIWRRNQAEHKWQLYSQAPTIFNLSKAARTLARELGDDPKEVVLEQQPQPQMALPPGMGGQGDARGSPGGYTSPDNRNPATPTGMPPLNPAGSPAGRTMQPGTQIQG